MPRLRSLLLLALCCPALASALTLRLCTDRRGHAPYLLADGSGSVGVLVAAAAREAGFDIEFTPLPIARCRAEITANRMDGFPLTPFAPELEGIVRYPERNGARDRARSVTVSRMMVFRRIGEHPTWDGRHFGGLDKPVLVAAGSILMRDHVRAAQAPIDGSGSSLAANFDKLLAGRGDAVIGFEGEGVLLLAQAAYAGKIEMLPVPLAEESYYLVVTRPFYLAHREAVEKMWNAVARLRAAAPPK